MPKANPAPRTFLSTPPAPISFPRSACQRLPRRSAARAARALILCLAALLPLGCNRARQPQVVVYVALDREFSEPILQEFTKTTGIRVLPKYDDESTKTVGLTTAIIQESNRPRCDVFWNNEILNTLRLEQKSLLDAYQSPAAADFPSAYRSPKNTWHGFAARARVLIVNTNLVPADSRPSSIDDLADPRWKGKTAIARPIAGTTASHAAVLFATLGEQKAKDFFHRLKANDIQILGGNKQIALACASGQIAFGLTDTDDAIIELERGAPVAIVYPDQAADQPGTLFIPNTLAILRNSPHPVEAKKLIDFLLTPAVEEKLAAGASAQIPLNPVVKKAPRVETPHTIKAMPVDFAAAVAAWENTAKFIENDFLAN